MKTKIEWKMLRVRLTACLIELWANEYWHALGPTSPLKQSGCGGKAHNFAAVRAELAPCRPSFPATCALLCYQTACKPETKPDFGEIILNI